MLAAITLIVVGFSFAAQPAQAHFGHYPAPKAAQKQAKHDKGGPLPSAPAKESRTCCGICALSGAGNALPACDPVVAHPTIVHRAFVRADRDTAPGGTVRILPPSRAPPVVR